jgi:hypothetical protein
MMCDAFVTELHKIKSRLRDRRYLQRGRSRVPRESRVAQRTLMARTSSPNASVGAKQRKSLRYVSDFSRMIANLASRRARCFPAGRYRHAP